MVQLNENCLVTGREWIIIKSNIVTDASFIINRRLEEVVNCICRRVKAAKDLWAPDQANRQERGPDLKLIKQNTNIMFPRTVESIKLKISLINIWNIGVTFLVWKVEIIFYKLSSLKFQANPGTVSYSVVSRNTVARAWLGQFWLSRHLYNPK